MEPEQGQRQGQGQEEEEDEQEEEDDDEQEEEENEQEQEEEEQKQQQQQQQDEDDEESGGTDRPSSLAISPRPASGWAVLTAARCSAENLMKPVAFRKKRHREDTLSAAEANIYHYLGRCFNVIRREARV